MYENFPYSNFHDLNTDWIVKKIKDVETSEANAKASEENAKASALNASLSDASAQTWALQANNSAKRASEQAQASAQSAAEADNYVTSTRDQVNLLQSRVDNIIPSGTQTEGNTELLDIRVGYNGVTYPSAGDAVRDQAEQLNIKSETIINDLFEPVHRRTVEQANISFNYYLDGTGKCIQASGYKMIKYPVTENSVLWLKSEKETDGTYQFQNNASVPSSLPNNNLVGKAFTTAFDSLIVVPTGASWIIISMETSNNTSGLYEYRQKNVFDLSMKNLIGSENNIKYPVYIPSGTTLTLSTSDHEILNQSGLNFLTFDANGDQVQYWNFPTGNISRTITTSSDAYFIGWNSKPNRPLQLETGSYYTDYVPYAVDIRNETAINNILNSVVKSDLLIQSFNSAYHLGAENFSFKCKEFSYLMYGDELADITAPEDIESFLFFTDPHLTMGSGWENKCYELIAQIQKYYNSTPTSFCLCGGDWFGNNDLPDEACFKLGYIDGFMHSMFDDCYMLVGNHDTNYQGKLTEDSERYTTRLSVQSIVDLWYRKNKKAYYSFEGCSTKFYAFDTGTEAQALTSYDNYGLKQVKWFASELLNDNTNHIALTSHILFNDLPSNSEVCPIMREVLLISEAYNNRTSIIIDDQTFDYSENTGKIEFAICGHSHGDYNGVLNGVPYVMTINAGVNNNTASFDLVLVDYTNRKINLVRVGNGSNRTVNLI